MLSINFHKTFLPERRLIAALLNFAESRKEGNFRYISAETGIPMGESSGKVPAILDYARGMGLIKINNKPDGVKKPILTSFGRIVFSEDKFLSEEMTQWLAHMHLCRNDIGAKTWNAMFAKGLKKYLGASFTKKEVEDYLSSFFRFNKDITGPLLLMYLDDAAFARAGVLTVSKESILRKKAPLLDSYALPFSAYLLSLMETFFPNQDQVTVTDLNEKTHWFDICLWNQSDIEYAFGLIERKGFLSIDRQMRPWIIEKLATADDVWPRIYDDMS
jgi:hypothetical protein